MALTMVRKISVPAGCANYSCLQVSYCLPACVIAMCCAMILADTSGANPG